MLWIALALSGTLVWLGILVLPWGPWRTREAFDAEAVSANPDLSDIAVIIPARNEAETIARTLEALDAQGQNLTINRRTVPSRPRARRQRGICA